MVKRAFLLLSLCFIIGCSGNKKDETPLIEGDVITEIHSFNSEGVMTSRYLLDHDGSRFTSYSRYDLNTEGEWQFFQSVDFTYDDQNRITEALFFYTEDRTDGAESKFGYEWGTDSYRFNRYHLDQNNEFQVDSFEDQPYNLPENGYKELNGYLWGFENGNYVGNGGESANGDLEVFGKTWSYNKSFLYDDQPNFRSDQALDFIMGQRNLFTSFNSNNWIGYRPLQGTPENYNHHFENGKIISITYDNGSKIEFSYVIDED